jgi:MmyB-like transcription regulator ligand binding domain
VGAALGQSSVSVILLMLARTGDLSAVATDCRRVYAALARPPALAEFRRRWASHNVRKHANGVIRYVHPKADELAFSYETFAFTTEPGLVLRIYHAEPGSPTADALALLAT